MPANVFQSKFVAVREPAWHRLGTVFPNPVDAPTAWAKMGPYIVEKRPLHYNNGLELGASSGWWGICRIDDDAIAATYGVVSSNYNLLSPQQFVDAYDLASKGRDIETMGALGKGETLFLTSPIRTIDVAGDEIQQYILLVNNMDGTQANYATLTGVRVVCQNTLTLALGDYSSVLKLNHTNQLINDTAKWLTDVIESSADRAEAWRQALELMTKKRMLRDETTRVVEHIVPIPPHPRATGSDLFDTARINEWERISVRRIAERDTIYNLFGGEGTGMDTRACQGTAFGLYNAVVEAYDHVISGKNEDTVARSSMFGERADTKNVAFKSLLTLSKN